MVRQMYDYYLKTSTNKSQKLSAMVYLSPETSHLKQIPSVGVSTDGIVIEMSPV